MKRSMVKRLLVSIGVLVAVAVVAVPVQGFNAGGSWEGIIGDKDGRLVTEFEYEPGRIGLARDYSVDGGGEVSLQAVPVGDGLGIPVFFEKGCPYLLLSAEPVDRPFFVYLPATMEHYDDFYYYNIGESNGTTLARHGVSVTVSLEIPYQMDGPYTVIPVQKLNGEMIIPLVLHTSVETPWESKEWQSTLLEDFPGYYTAGLEWALVKGRR